MHTKAALIWYNIKYSIIVKYYKNLNDFSIWIHQNIINAEFSAAITPVFGIAWSFILICWFEKTVVLLNIEYKIQKNII